MLHFCSGNYCSCEFKKQGSEVNYNKEISNLSTWSEYAIFLYLEDADV